MVSAAVAAFFYLRVAITMFSPVGEIADSATTPHPADGYTAGDGDDPHAGRAMPAGLSGDGDSGDRGDAVSSLLVLTDAPPGESVLQRGVVPVPALTVLAVGISVAFTVVFGIIPGPILDFAHQATLLFS